MEKLMVTYISPRDITGKYEYIMHNMEPVLK